jgi:hypothetical protein
VAVRYTGGYRVDLLHDLMKWAIERDDRQKILDILEHLGYVANSQDWPVVLYAMTPLLSMYRTGHSEVGRPASSMPPNVEAKAIEVLASAWSRGPSHVESHLESLDIPKAVRDEVFVKKGDPRIVSHFGKGLPWLRFVVRSGYSAAGASHMMELVRSAIHAKSFRRFLVQAGQRAVNILYGQPIFLVAEEA